MPARPMQLLHFTFTKANEIRCIEHTNQFRITFRFLSQTDLFCVLCRNLLFVVVGCLFGLEKKEGDPLCFSWDKPNTAKPAKWYIGPSKIFDSGNVKADELKKKESSATSNQSRNQTSI